MTEKRRQ